MVSLEVGGKTRHDGTYRRKPLVGIVIGDTRYGINWISYDPVIKLERSYTPLLVNSPPKSYYDCSTINTVMPPRYHFIDTDAPQRRKRDEKP